MIQTKKNVVTEIVNHDLCDGCGVCAGICPSGVLTMRFNEFGEYIAAKSEIKCFEYCRLCLMVCPFSDVSENEDVLAKELFGDISVIKYRRETGYYLDSFVGYSTTDEHRANGASGGLTTWTLETLLRTGEVEHVACVSPTREPDRLFKFVICSRPEEVRGCSKSCYYPVEISEILRYIISHEGRYAIIGLPCVIEALRSAMRLKSELRERIRYLLGLVCGQDKGKFFAEYLCSLAGGDPSHLREIGFRVKDPVRSASDFGAKLVWEDRRHKNHVCQSVVYWTGGMDEAWVRRYFTLNSCDYCDDLFAELADVTFMDAWLPEYIADAAGTNLVIVRNPELTGIFQKGLRSNQIKLDAIDIQSVIRSQQGALYVKRQGLARRLALAAKLGSDVHSKRVAPVERIGRLELFSTYIDEQILHKSKIAFKQQRAVRPDLKVFRHKMELWILLAWIVQKMKRLRGRIKLLFTH